MMKWQVNFMQNMEMILNRAYDKPFYKTKTYRKAVKKMDRFLKPYDILVEGKSDVDCFEKEIIYHSLKTKQQFEDVFFDTYVSMYDYWYDLTYQERKKQMNMEIEKLMAKLPYFMSKGQRIFLPCFDERFNNLYTDEIVLLDLKQYHRYIRTCHQEIKLHPYGAQCYKNDFSSAEVLFQKDGDFVLYHPLMHRFYVNKNNTWAKVLSFDPKKECSEEALRKLAVSIFYDEEDTVINILLKEELVGKKIKRRLEKYQRKKQKKLKKEKE